MRQNQTDQGQGLLDELLPVLGLFSHLCSRNQNPHLQVVLRFEKKNEKERLAPRARASVEP